MSGCGVLSYIIGYLSVCVFVCWWWGGGEGFTPVKCQNGVQRSPSVSEHKLDTALNSTHYDQKSVFLLLLSKLHAQRRVGTLRDHLLPRLQNYDCFDVVH